MAALLRFYRLGAQSLWIDEVFTWLSAGGGQPTLTARDLLENVHGPLFSLALHAWMRVAGESEWALRFLPAVAGTLMVPVMAWLADSWLGRSAAVPAAWLTAGSPFLVWYSQETRGYAWLMLFAALSCATLLELQRRCDAGRVALHLLASAAALLSNLSFALLVPLQLSWWFAGGAPTRVARRRWLLATVVIALLVAAPWVPQVARTWDWRRLEPGRESVHGETPLRQGSTFHAGAVPFAAYSFSVGFSYGPSLRELRRGPSWAPIRQHLPAVASAGIVFGILGVLGIVAVARRRRVADTLLWLVAPALLVSYFAAQNFKTFNPRYLAVCMPVVVLLFAAGMADLGGRRRALMVLAVAGVWAVALSQHYLLPQYGREDYRGALKLVRAGFMPGEQVLAVGSEEPVIFYARGLASRRWWIGHVDHPIRWQQTWIEATSQASGTWVVLSRSEDLDPKDRFATWLDQHYPQAPCWQMAGVRLWHIPGGGVSGAPSVPH
ncbi:MAG: glycosyltransferase family 39 protein [Candidatus Eisenbacteria bacterium]